MEQSNRKWFERKLERITARIATNYIGIAKIESFVMPSVWAEQNINFRGDVSSDRDRFDLSLTPYLKDPLDAWAFNTITEVSVMAPEQTGKSLSWVIGLLWSFNFKPCLSLVVYPSDDLGVKINKEKLEPLMKEIPKLAAELAMPRSQKKDCYHFSNLKSYFNGAGSRVTSQSSKIRVGDEIDDWIQHEGKVTNIEDVRKRARAFDESMFYKVCTPTVAKGAIAKEFDNSSQGYWHLQCLGCGKHTLRSADVHNMQWELDGYGDIIEDSIRLICPVCRTEHVEAQKVEMNLKGEYIHKYPERLKYHKGFQWGALASQFKTLCWLEIAKAQMKAGKSGDIQDHRLFDNSIRGLPISRRKPNTALIEEIKKHCIGYLPTEKVKDENIAGLFYAGDTQDDSIYYVIFALDTKSNLYLIDNKKEIMLDNIKKLFDDGWNGHKILAGIQDEGGHRTLEIQKFARSIPNLYSYKGNNRITTRIEKSKNVKSLLLVKESIFRSELLYYLYSQQNKDNNYIFFNNETSEEFINQITDYKKNSKVKNGDEYENWISSGNDHYFDCMKMLLSLIEYCKKKYPASRWLTGEAEWMKSKKKIVYKKRNSFAKSWRE